MTTTQDDMADMKAWSQVAYDPSQGDIINGDKLRRDATNAHAELTRPVDCHHLKEGLAHERGIGRKATDRWAVPLCRHKHEELERLPSTQEWAWFRRHGIEDPLEFAAALWRNTGDLERMERVLRAHMVPRD